MAHLYRDTPRRRAALLLAAAVLALGFAAPAAYAQAKITRLVVAFPPGGPVDFVARTIGEQLGKELGSQVIIENRGRRQRRDRGRVCGARRARRQHAVADQRGRGGHQPAAV